MSWAPPLLLVGAVAAVGVLHTIVPDHWVPIALLARQRGWSSAETARAALQAGTGHVLSTLAIGLAVWGAGAVFAARFGQFVDLASSAALVGLGGWIALSAWRELRLDDAHPHAHGHGHSHLHWHTHAEEEDSAPSEWLAAAHAPAVDDDPLYLPLRGETGVVTHHAHLHRHGQGRPHLHWHDHTPATGHPLLAEFAAEPPFHVHRHKNTARTATLLVLGSSPMVEGIPAFFAAAKYGPALLAAMAGVFALATITTYVALATWSSAGLQRLRLGAVERWGEVLSGLVIALVGVAFGLWPALLA